MVGDSLDERKSLSLSMSVVAFGILNVIFVTFRNVHHYRACCKTHSCVSGTYFTYSASSNGTLPKIETRPEKKNGFSRRLAYPICNNKFPCVWTLSRVWYLITRENEVDQHDLNGQGEGREEREMDERYFIDIEFHWYHIVAFPWHCAIQSVCHAIYVTVSHTVM